jgi:hypothetical protein
MEHTSCQERRMWYYEHNMWWQVKKLQKEVVLREKDFENKYFKKGEEIKDWD